jgi:hypothetical protein
MGGAESGPFTLMSLKERHLRWNRVRHFRDQKYGDARSAVLPLFLIGVASL